MKRMRVFAAAPVVFLATQLFAGSAGAAIVLNEADVIGADFGNNDGGTPYTVNLTEGVNLVSGISSGSGGDVGPKDFDDLILNVPGGYELTSIRLLEWNVDVGPSVHTVTSSYSLWSGTTIATTQLENDSIILFSDQVPADSAPYSFYALTLGAGNYLLNQFGLGILGGDSALFSYEWEFTVSAVPLPPAAWLFISGLLAMVGLNRRQRRAAPA